VEIGEVKQQFEQTSTVFREFWPIVGKQLHGEITLPPKPSECPGVREFVLAATLLDGRETSEDFVQIVCEAYPLATERRRYGSGTGADTAGTNLSGYDDHTSSLSSGSSMLWVKQARNQLRWPGYL
jgi:hypothetical protein